MHPYELMVILDPSVEERTVAPSLDKFLSVVKNGGGTIENVEIWGNVVWPTKSTRRPKASTPS